MLKPRLPGLRLATRLTMIFQHFLSSADFFEVNFFAKFFQDFNIRVSSNLDPDHACHSVGPDLGPNCLQR